MPIYEYQCSACEHRFDQLQKIAEEPLKTCSECKKETLIKLVSAPSFRLSGSGWYETDFKTDKDKKKNLKGDQGKQSSSSESSSGDKTASSKATEGTGSSSKTKANTKPIATKAAK